jgi:DNA-binding MarR family transcriptional regulator
MDEAPEPHKITDLEALKALTHPRRRRILGHLAQHGPATSATLAQALGLNTGATSYHLRELARHGFIEEVPERAHGRERWWRPVHRDIRFPLRSERDEHTQRVMDGFDAIALEQDLAAFRRAQAELDESDPWSDAFPYSHGMIRVTLPELRDFFEAYIALLQRYDRQPDEAPDDARVVLTRFLAFPAPSNGP